jgi:hypothetical protein
MTAKYKSGLALVLALGGLAWWYILRIAKTTKVFKSKRTKTGRAYGMAPNKSGRGVSQEDKITAMRNYKGVPHRARTTTRRDGI